VDMLRNTYPITKCGTMYCFQYSILPRPLQAEDFERNKECLLEILFDENCMRMFLLSIERKMEEASLGLQYETAAIYRDLLGHVLYVKKGHPKNGSQFEDKEILMGEVIENGYKLFYISDNRVVLKRKYRRLGKKSLEAFVNKARQLKDTQELELDEKSQLDFKRIISAELKDTGTKAVSFADGRLDLELFINRLRKKGKA
jgi:excinuclease ABC subunit C